MTDLHDVHNQAAQYVADVQSLMQELPLAAVPPVVEALLGARARGRHVFVCGNGGSAARGSSRMRSSTSVTYCAAWF